MNSVIHQGTAYGGMAQKKIRQHATDTFPRKVSIYGAAALPTGQAIVRASLAKEPQTKVSGNIGAIANFYRNPGTRNS